MRIYDLMFYFYIYSFLGWCTEVAFATVKQRQFVNRGFLNGPVCPVYGVGVVSVVTLLEPFRNRLLLLYVLSVILVTLIEGMTGWILDRLFHHKWWDYTAMPLNIGGYVCLLFSVVWGLACVLIVKLIHPLTEKLVEILPVSAGLVLLTGFTACLAADVAVTTGSVLKLNRRLDMLEKIGLELHEISDKMGSNIHENVMDAMEKFEDAAQERKERLTSLTEETKEKTEWMRRHSVQRYEELRSKYEELAGATLHGSRRLVKAFPKMESRKHKDLLEQMKKRLGEKSFRK